MSEERLHLIQPSPPRGYDTIEEDDDEKAAADSGGGAAAADADGGRFWTACKRYAWEVFQRACWIGVGLPLIVVVGGAASYFMGALSTVDLYRYVFPLGAISDHWLVLGVVFFSTIIASIGCVLWMGVMAMVWSYPLSLMRALYTIFCFIGVMGAGQFGMSAAQQYALGDAQHGNIYKNVYQHTPISSLPDAAGIVFAPEVTPEPSKGASTWAPDLNYATQVCVSPMVENHNSRKACFWAVSFGGAPTRGCEPPSHCAGDVCMGTTAEAKQYKYYVDDAIKRSVTYKSQFEPCAEYMPVLLRDKIDLKELQEKAYGVARMWLLGGFIAALLMALCLSILCRRVVWADQ
eukprot:CAMPEP_0167791684 /NCGR_PEP_ID=MMETSP0111_2-20121227/12086_1 /TAXON_ID=91324 /ORGANISM="Lotharella globosa, Strain CCCM811" /LENGTH=347 /DNA_ID=CAMNT_0007684407 /DNA_START=80 /DNA_END=1123 /DNA_ORIENTATION=+